MNILFYAYSFVPNNGGVERVTDIISRELIKRGHHVYFLCGCDKDIKDESVLAAPIFYLHGRHDSELSHNDVTWLKQFAEDNHIDVIINQYPLFCRGDNVMKALPPSVKKIAFYHGKPFGYINVRIYVQKHKSISLRKYLSIIKRYYEFYKERQRFRQIYRLVDKFCLLCNDFVVFFCKELSLSADKMVAIGNPNTFIVNLTDDNFSQKENKVIFVGRVNDVVKNVGDFITAWAIVAEKHHNWNAEIIGRDDDCEQYKQIIKSRNIPRIAFLGHKTDVEKYYERAKILCMTSLTEGWPMVITESMAKGCVPCVYGTFGSVYEILNDRKSGIIVSPPNAENMALALDSLMCDQIKLEAMSVEAQKDVNRFSVGKIVDKYEAIFKELCH